MTIAQTTAKPAGGYQSEPRKLKSVTLRSTYWGYILVPNSAANRRASVVEVLCLFFSVMLIIAGLGQWILPGAATGPEVLGIKAGATLVFVLLGGVLMWYAQRGLATEVQIDLVEGQVRLVARNRRGKARVQTAMDFDEVGSAFIHRSHAPFVPSRLFLRYCDTEVLIEVACGPEAELEDLLDRLAADLVAPPSAVRRADAA